MFLMAIPMVALLVVISGALAALDLGNLLSICVVLELVRVIAIAKFHDPKFPQAGFFAACFSFFLAELIYFLAMGSLLQGDSYLETLFWTNWQDFLFSVYIALFNVFASLSFVRNGSAVRQVAATVLMLVALRYGLTREFEGGGLLQTLPSELSGLIICGVLLLAISVLRRILAKSLGSAGSWQREDVLEL